LEKRIAGELNLSTAQVRAVIELLEGGATIPFIARYRKERSGNLDEVRLAEIQTVYRSAQDLEKRRSFVLEQLHSADVRDAKLLERVKSTFDQVELEDLYLPFKKSRQTRADKAKKLGLTPLAKMIMGQKNDQVMQQASHFRRNGLSLDEVLQGARDIIAEWISENVNTRNRVRNFIKRNAVIQSKLAKGKENEAEKYRDYYNFEQSIRRIPSHRLLAIFRAEKEGLLKVKFKVEDALALRGLEEYYVQSSGESGKQVKKALSDSYRRLIKTSIETEVRKELKLRADKEAIAMFATNLDQKLLQAPLGPKRILAIDPGFRSGCKVVCLDEKGDLLHHTTIFPHPPQKQTK